jgi:hypothetical protein
MGLPIVAVNKLVAPKKWQMYCLTKISLLELEKKTFILCVVFAFLET